MVLVKLALRFRKKYNDTHDRKKPFFHKSRTKDQNTVISNAFLSRLPAHAGRLGGTAQIRSKYLCENLRDLREKNPELNPMMI